MSKRNFKVRQKKQQNYEAPLHDEEAMMDFVDDIPEIPKESSKLKKLGSKVKATAKKFAKPVANIAATGAIAGGAAYGVAYLYCMATGRELYLIPKEGIHIYEAVIHDVAEKLYEVGTSETVADTVKEVASAASEEA